MGATLDTVLEMSVAKRGQAGNEVEGFALGSGDYLRDRGYPDPPEARAKFFAANEISTAIQQLWIFQSEAARIAGLKQPNISRIVNGNVKEYSVWRLLNTLRTLGFSISIRVERVREGRGCISARNVSDKGEPVPLA